MSIALNVMLVTTITVLALHNRSRANAPSQPKSDLKTTATAIHHDTTTTVTPIFVEQPKLPQYAEIKSITDRRRTIIDQLRAMGVSNDFLALVAKVDFETEWDGRFDECKGDMDKLAAVQLAMNMNKDAAMRAALGEEGFRKWDQKTMLWEAMSTPVDVTTSEASAIYDLKKKLQQRGYELDQARLNGTMDDAQINAASDKAYAEYFQKMKDILGDDRYKKSQQLDGDFLAGNLRAQLAKANPSDSQFQELFKTEQDFNNSRMELDHQFQDDVSSPEYQAKLKALSDAHDQEYRRVLGSNVFYSLQQQQDSGYSQMKKYEDLWGLDDTKINFVYDTLRNYQKSLQDYQAQLLTRQAQHQAIDLETVKNNLAKITDQTSQTLQNYLGQDSFNRLQRNRVIQFSQVRLMPQQ
jgi:hypothetical protein